MYYFIVAISLIAKESDDNLSDNHIPRMKNRFYFILAFSQVETIGDAYCVACGLHRNTNTHAQQIAWMGLKMIQTCSHHLTHEGKPIKVLHDDYMITDKITIIRDRVAISLQHNIDSNNVVNTALTVLLQFYAI